MSSLRTRLLLAASLVLAAFVALCGAALESAFRDSAMQAQRDKLEGLVYAIIDAADPVPGGDLTIATDKLPDPRLKQPQSGLDAALLNELGEPLWLSPDFPHKRLGIQPPSVNEWRFQKLSSPDSFALSYGVRFPDLSDEPRRYTIVVLQDTVAFDAEVSTFRRTLWIWLVGSAVLLLAALLAVLRWGLHPLRRLAGELNQIEQGRKSRIETRYPRELAPLAGALNAMLAAERSQQTRYRNALGDLAHSLKTPLAVLQGMNTDAQASEQLGRIQHIVDYQLRHAAAAGTRTLSEPVQLRALTEKISGALIKVYADKALQFDLQIAPALRLRADQGDLYEMLGNLLDNASKYGRSRVLVSAQAAGDRSQIVVEDDGPGFPEHAEQLFERGVRADDRTPGQGIGLAAVAALVAAYDGRIQLERSASLGGAKVIVTI